MNVTIFEGVMTALSSISHGGDTFGVNKMLRREKIAQPDGSVIEIPIVSGNSIRGLLRDRGMLHMLRALGYGIEDDTGKVEGLSLPAFHFLFSGGVLTSTGARGLDIDQARRWRELVPLVSVFGGAVGNQIMNGKLIVDKGIPICKETLHLIPPRFAEGPEIVSIWDLCQEEAYTRRDDEKQENMRQLISPKVRKVLEDKSRVEREKLGTDEDKRKKDDPKQQMRYFTETLCAGTRLYWGIVLNDVTDLEFEAFAAALGELGRLPYIGGNSRVGHGKVAIQFDKWIRIDPRAEPVGEEVGFPLGSVYEAHLKERGDEIRELLDELL